MYPKGRQCTINVTSCAFVKTLLKTVSVTYSGSVFVALGIQH